MRLCVLGPVEAAAEGRRADFASERQRTILAALLAAGGEVVSTGGAGSVFLCTPISLAQDGATGLGAQGGPDRLLNVLSEAGFTHCRVATETPFNLILERSASSRYLSRPD